VTGGSIPSVVVVCGDPGGANAVAPVIRKLVNDKRVSVSPFAYFQAKAIWKNYSFPFQNLPDHTTRETTALLLQDLGADLVFVGTSFNHLEFEKLFISAAKSLKIPSLALLDYWSNYTIRFSKRDADLMFLPDTIAIMDEFTKNEMIRDGFDPGNLVITGQPAFDDLLSLRDSFTGEKKAQIRTGFGCHPGDLLVIFASEPVFAGTPKKPEDPGYTRSGVIRSLISSLDNIQETTGRKIVLVIRPHPRESIEDFRDLPFDDRGTKTRIILSTEGRSREMLPAADLVIGMTTILLMEACYLGCTVASLQPGLSGKDPLPSNRLGCSIPIYHEEDIIPILQTLLLDETKRSKLRTRCMSLIPKIESADRVARQIYTMCGIL